MRSTAFTCQRAAATTAAPAAATAAAATPPAPAATLHPRRQQPPRVLTPGAADLLHQGPGRSCFGTICRRTSCKSDTGKLLWWNGCTQPVQHPASSSQGQIRGLPSDAAHAHARTASKHIRGDASPKPWITCWRCRPVVQQGLALQGGRRGPASGRSCRRLRSPTLTPDEGSRRRVIVLRICGRQTHACTGFQ